MPRFTPIPETSYLTAQTASEYRCIMRVFYQEYEHMHFQLYEEEVLELLRKQYPEEFLEYGGKELRQDLDQLVGWKNLTPFQDPKRVYTIADYKNKKYRYAMSEAAVEIERMTVRLENLLLEPASLSTNYFVRIEKALEMIPELAAKKDRKKAGEWWNSLQEDFKSLNQNYQDYLREFYTGRSEKILKSVEFVLHKDHFISYLQEFIRQLQSHSDEIGAVLTGLPGEALQQALSLAVQAELSVPRPVSEKREDLEEVIRGNIRGRFEALERWFLAKDGYASESSRILDITNEIIQKIIQNAALIVQLQNWGISRKADYIRYIDMFLSCPEMEDAHRLAAHVFGVQKVRHFRVTGDRQTDSINVSTSEEAPSEFLLTPHTRRYKPRLDRSGFEGKELKKAQARAAYLKKTDEERETVLRYIRDGRIVLADIQEEVPAHVRQTFLKWISDANMNSRREGRTEYGQSFSLLKGEEKITLFCEDGNLEMPSYTFLFTNRET